LIKLLSLEKRTKMHAAVFYGPNSISYVDYRNPMDTEANRVSGSILKVNACSICAYDARVFRNGHSKVIPPIILGHEICGHTVEDITIRDHLGSSTEIRSDTRVVISPIVPCLKCVYCASKQYNLCNNLKEIGSSVNGGFAEYINIPKQLLEIGGIAPIPDCLTNEEAALIEPLSCCINGFSHIGYPLETESVVVLGDGPIGLLHLQLCKKLYRAKTVVVGKIPQRLKKASSMGADATIRLDDGTSNNDNNENYQVYDHRYINGRNDLNTSGSRNDGRGSGGGSSKSIDEVLQFTAGKGADIITIATNNPAALDFALKVASKNSRINIFSGIANSSFAGLFIDPNWLHYNQISITGSFSSTPRSLQEAIRLAGSRKVDLSKLIGRTYSLADIEQALLTTEKCIDLRAVINKF
jgi:L-iditol 2-dehydrogenase